MKERALDAKPAIGPVREAAVKMKRSAQAAGACGARDACQRNPARKSPLEGFRLEEVALMKTLTGLVSSAALTCMLASPLVLADNTKPDAFIQKAIAGNLAEIKVGQLAQQKGASAGVRHFGTVLEQDHSTANQQAMTAASTMGVTPPAEPSAKEQMEYGKLASLSGTRFDEAFVKAMVKDHKKDIAEYKKEAKAAGNSPAASYAETSLPTLQKHLRLAESLERHPGG